MKQCTWCHITKPIEEFHRDKRIKDGHKAKLLQATPMWADARVNEHIYVQCAQLSADTGGRFEVDHIVPLDNKLVCGLHVETNLRIITKSHNCSKKNRFVI